MRRFLIELPPCLPSIVALVVLFYFTLVPKPLPDMDVPLLNFDKVVHVIMMLSVYLTFAFDYTRRERQHRLPLTIRVVFLVIAVLLGGFIELAQGTEIIHRGCDLYDFIADAVGAIAGFFTARRVMGYLIG
ncbi:MAG: hypothetical protein IJY31_03630 [Muribaculaceae bacterium]|nr:hypothetical protein [Muribaculaceae bacterium]